tara:strand:+ start:12244 stop:12540 length:297 start_codon:yes stop_codon:yes gene_type:complete
MIYEFVNIETGESRELHYQMGSAPVIGEIIKKNGEEYRRVSSFQVDSGIDAKVHGYPYLSNSLPRNLEGCDTNRQGKPIITSRNHEKEVISRHGYERE